jgi:hypothetical protein
MQDVLVAPGLNLITALQRGQRANCICLGLSTFTLAPPVMYALNWQLFSRVGRFYQKIGYFVKFPINFFYCSTLGNIGNKPVELYPGQRKGLTLLKDQPLPRVPVL